MAVPRPIKGEDGATAKPRLALTTEQVELIQAMARPIPPAGGDAFRAGRHAARRTGIQHGRPPEGRRRRPA
jgi:hypothetical protein